MEGDVTIVLLVVGVIVLGMCCVGLICSGRVSDPCVRHWPRCRLAVTR